MTGAGKALLIAGLVIAALGLLLMAGDKLPFQIGRLPGDIVWKRGNATFYFPITTLILINVAIWLVLRLFSRN